MVLGLSLLFYIDEGTKIKEGSLGHIIKRSTYWAYSWKLIATSWNHRIYF